VILTLKGFWNLGFTLNGAGNGKTDKGHRKCTDRGLKAVSHRTWHKRELLPRTKKDEFWPPGGLRHSFCVVIHSHCCYFSPFLSSLTGRVSVAVIRQCMFPLWGVSRSHGLVWYLKKTRLALGFPHAKLPWHLSWQDCGRTGGEGEAMPFPCSLCIVDCPAVMTWMRKGGGMELSGGYPHPP